MQPKALGAACDPVGTVLEAAIDTALRVPVVVLFTGILLSLASFERYNTPELLTLVHLRQQPAVPDNCLILSACTPPTVLVRN